MRRIGLLTALSLLASPAAFAAALQQPSEPPPLRVAAATLADAACTVAMHGSGTYQPGNDGKVTGFGNGRLNNKVYCRYIVTYPDGSQEAHFINADGNPIAVRRY